MGEPEALHAARALHHLRQRKPGARIPHVQVGQRMT